MTETTDGDTQEFWRELRHRVDDAVESALLDADEPDLAEAERRLAEAGEAPLPPATIAAIVRNATREAAPVDDQPRPIAIARARRFPWAKAAALLLGAGIVFGIGGKLALERLSSGKSFSSGAVSYGVTIQILMSPHEDRKARTNAATTVYNCVRYGVQTLKAVASEGDATRVVAEGYLRQLRQLGDRTPALSSDELPESLERLGEYLTSTRGLDLQARLEQLRLLGASTVHGAVALHTIAADGPDYLRTAAAALVTKLQELLRN